MMRILTAPVIAAASASANKLSLMFVFHRRAGVNQPAKDDSISRVSRKNQPMVSGSSWVADVSLGWERLGQAN